MDKVAAVVWDWNGTLLDDLTAAVRAINRVLAEFGLPRLGGVADYHRVFAFPIVDYYARLGFDTAPGGNFDHAAHRFIETYAAEAQGAPLHQGATEVLAGLHAAGVTQVIVSATEQSRLLAQVAPYGLDRWIDAAHGIEDIYARSKAHIAERWLVESGLDPATVLFVGDSEHDHEIATGLGARCVLYGGGHHAPAHLARLPAPLIDDLRTVPRLAGVA